VRNQGTEEAKPAWRIFFKIFIAGGGMWQDVAGRRGMPQFAPTDWNWFQKWRGAESRSFDSRRDRAKSGRGKIGRGVCSG
jgi:hypothetical protein